MEETEEYSLCILCCYSFPNSSTKSPPEEDERAVTKFIQQTGLVDKLSLSSGELLTNGEVSVCPECLSGVGKAVDKREQVEEVEVHVRNLQEEILRLMRQLRGLMNGYLEEMKGLEGKIRCGDEDCLRARFGGKRGRMKEGTWTKESVLQFRSGVLNVVKDLIQFRDDLAAKLLDNAELPVKIISEVKVEPSAYLEDNAEPPEGFQDIDYSSLREDEEDNSNDCFPEPPKPRKSSRKRATKRSYPNDQDDPQNEDSDYVPSPEPPPPKRKTTRKPKVTKKSSVPLKKKPASASSSKVPKLPISQSHRPSWFTAIHQRLPNGKLYRKRYYHCLLCPTFQTKMMFHFEQHLRAHERESKDDNPEEKFNCSLCPSSFFNQQHKEYHECLHQGVFKVTCDLCQKYFLAFDLKKHLEEDHHLEKVIQCSCCVQVLSTREKYLKHLDYHIGNDAQMGCDLCQETFPKKKQLEAHFGEAHGLLFEEVIKPVAPPSITQSKTEITVEDHNDDDEDVTDKPPGYLPSSKRQRPSWYTTTRYKTKNDTKSSYFCLQCPDYLGRTYQGLEQHLMAHERTLTPDQKIFQCPHCPSISFATEQYYQLHLYYHQGLFQVKCDQCNLYQLVFNLEAHLKEEHGVKHLFRCASCCNINSTRQRYIIHLQKFHHGKDAIIKCDLCPETFPQVRLIIAHYKDKHDIIDHEEHYKTLRERKYQLKRAQERVLCPECGKCLKPESLKDHIACVHSNNLRPWQCPHCSKAFKTKANLTGHLVIHKRQGNEFQYQCHLCTKGFQAKESLTAHVRLHEGTGFTCEKCGLMVGDKKTLKVHLKMHEKHEKMKWWQCTKCAFKFSSEDKLKRHGKVHEKKTENRCGICDKVFNKLFYLKAHYKAMHESEKQFVCNICGSACTMESNLRAHKRNYHPEEYKASLKRPRKQPNIESVDHNDNDDTEEKVDNELLNFM